MQGKFFLDTNIFVYSFDDTAKDKQQQARELIKEGLKSGNGHISFQVIQEFFNVATKKFAVPMPLLSSKEYLDKVFMQLEVVYPDGEYVKIGLDIAATTGYSFYDSLIISTALKADCETLYTEDLQNGQKIRNLTLVNPFTA
ncbi:MAG TPA: PIN domain-containing protein [Desulfobulbaceae bacterium]|nr:PIN domain-containing protein [Desulfobulbaceae bacterium]